MQREWLPDVADDALLMAESVVTMVKRQPDAAIALRFRQEPPCVWSPGTPLPIGKMLMNRFTAMLERKEMRGHRDFLNE